MATWNEIHHIGVNDLIFALGLREGSRRSRFAKNSGKRSRRQVGDSRHGEEDFPGDDGSAHSSVYAGDSDGGGSVDEGVRVVQPCGSGSCVERENVLDLLLNRRVALQVTHIQAKKGRTSATMRVTTAEAAKHEKTQEVLDIEEDLRKEEAISMELEALLSAAKGHEASLEQAMHDLSAERARLRREHLRDITPVHLRSRFPSGVEDAGKGINFSHPLPRRNRLIRPETVFAILEDGMPGGRLETREGAKTPQAGINRPFTSPIARLSSSSSSPAFGSASASALGSAPSCITSLSPCASSDFPMWPTTPPRFRFRGEGATVQPRLYDELAVSPIQSSGSIGDLRIFPADFSEVQSPALRRARQLRTRRRARAKAEKAARATKADDDNIYNGRAVTRG